MELKVEDTNHFPCPSCGGHLAFDPDTQMLKCDYCDNKLAIDQVQNEIHEYDFSSAEDPAFQNWGHEKKVIHCESCGAQTVINATDAAQFCAFCGSSHISDHDESAGIRPESLIPFKLTKNKAETLFVQWIGKKWFAPRDLRTNYKSNGIQGIYIPCWTYDANSSSIYTAEGGTYYYVAVHDTVHENGKSRTVARQERRIRWWDTSGTYLSSFNDLVVNASSQTDGNLMIKLEPFRMEELVPYKPEMLAGFLAEKYSVSLQDGWSEAAKRFEPSIREGIITQIGADEVRNLQIQTAYEEIKFKHILLPFWISAYRYKSKSYKFMVNGQTGEVQGYAPVSFWKVAGVVVLALVIISMVVLVFINQNG